MKPKDVTDEVWEMAQIIAKEATRDAMRDPLMPYFVTVSPHIASAIMTEREACARVAEEVGIPLVTHRPQLRVEMVPVDIAKAIRNRP